MGRTNKLFIVADDSNHASINTTAFNDRALSYKAMGIHAYIRTRPHGTIITLPDLRRGSADGEYSIRSGIKELVQAKYLYLTKLRDSLGRIDSVVYISFPVPTRIKQSDLSKIVKTPVNYPDRENHKVDEKRDRKKGKNPVNYPDRENHKVGGHVNLNYNLNYINSPYGELNKLNYNKRTGAVRCSHSKPENLDKHFGKAESLFEFWNSLPNTPTHQNKNSTKVYKAAIQSLLKAVKRYPVKTIESAMQAYSHLLGAPGTVIRNGEAPFRVGLDQFFHFHGYTDQLRRKDNHPLARMKNWFTECAKGEAYLLDTYTKIKRDKNQRLTQALTSAVLHDQHFCVEQLSAQQQNTLIQAGAKMREFLDKNRKLFQSSSHLASRSPESVCVDRLFEYLHGTGRKLHLGYLASDITWGNLGAYMTEMGVIAPRSNSGGFRSIRDAARS